jgi:UDP-2,3-diacylglucosamine pyrophosphatase LpxH
MFSWARPTPLHVPRRIPADRPVYIVSDLHLGDGTRSDSFLGKDAELLAFLEQVEREGAHLVIAGDAIDFHQAWFITRVLKAHARLIGAFSRLAARTGVTYIWGNHDHDISVFRDMLRMDVCSSLEIGDAVLVRHGYEYDPYIGPYLEQSHVATRVHHLFERVLETWLRMPLENFYNPANRLTFWLSHKVVLLGLLAERLGLGRLGSGIVASGRFWTQSQLGDPQCIFEYVRKASLEGPYRWVVTGHSHLPGVVRFSADRYYANTGSWTFNSSQYAYFDGQTITVRDWITGRVYDDRAYLPLLDGRFRHMGFMEWWRENYLGWGRFRAGYERRMPSGDEATETRPGL